MIKTQPEKAIDTEKHRGVRLGFPIRTILAFFDL